MTADELAAARRALDMGVYELADALGLAGSAKAAGDRLRAMERGARPISGPVSQLVSALLDGWRPGRVSDAETRALRRMTQTVGGLLNESQAAMARARTHGACEAGLLEAAKAEGIARAASAMSHTLKELAL